MSAFVQHTSALCLSFGLLFSLVSPRLDALFAANFSTIEAQAMVRHFGLAMLFLASLCIAVQDQPPQQLSSLLVAWHAGVMGAWSVEITVLGAFRSCPVHTRCCVYAGAAFQMLLLCEGLIEVGPSVYASAAAAAAVGAASVASATERPDAAKHKK